jgi:hypothetical protein
VPDAALHPRFVVARLTEALADTPVVLIHGPRQCSKTTLARVVGEPRGYASFSSDDEVARAAAAADPVGFVADLPERAVLDEVQRVPALFTSLLEGDLRRSPWTGRAWPGSSRTFLRTRSSIRPRAGS